MARPCRTAAPRTVALGLAVVMALGAAVGCSGLNLLGGREECWPEEDGRGASIWGVILRLDQSGARLETPEGDVTPLLPGTLTTRFDRSGAGDLMRSGDVVARSGDDVTLFGGIGARGDLVVCGIEEVHASG